MKGYKRGCEGLAVATTGPTESAVPPFVRVIDCVLLGVDVGYTVSDDAAIICASHTDTYVNVELFGRFAV